MVFGTPEVDLLKHPDPLKYGESTVWEEGGDAYVAMELAIVRKGSWAAVW